MNIKYLWVFPLATFSFYCFVSFYVLMTGHLHEDAYILYIFSESLANGNGISYFPGGPPAEGATDFLWMLLLAFGKYLNIDVAISATILNGIGLAAITFFSIRLLPNNVKYWKVYTVSSVLVFVILLSQVAQASVAGFSSGFYCSFVAAIFYLLFTRNLKWLFLIPLLGITIGLLRPDGVIIGSVASLVGMYFTFRSDVYKKYLISSAVAIFIGVIYFYWRYQYFGYLLPLPLYVKGTSISNIPGVYPHLYWLYSNVILGLLAFITIVFYKDRSKVILAGVPVFCLFFALLFATQSQNVSFRFQAPGTTLLILIVSILFSEILSNTKVSRILRCSISTILSLLFLGVLTNSSKEMIGAVDVLKRTDYINYFPFHFSKIASSQTKIALTEAGRFAYWSKREKYDLVGLNTPEIAIDKVTPTYLSRLDPDVVFIHTSGYTDYSKMCDKIFCEIRPEKVRDGMVIDKDWRNVSYGVKRAPLVVFEYVSNNLNNYIVIVAEYYGKYNHLYLVKKDGDINIDRFKKSLEKSYMLDQPLSYWEMKKDESFSGVFD